MGQTNYTRDGKAEFATFSAKTMAGDDEQCLVATRILSAQYKLQFEEWLQFVVSDEVRVILINVPVYLSLDGICGAKSLVNFQKALALCNPFGFKFQLCPLEVSSTVPWRVCRLHTR